MSQRETRRREKREVETIPQAWGSVAENPYTSITPMLR
jgi:hypothetical protein